MRRAILTLATTALLFSALAAASTSDNVGELSAPQIEDALQVRPSHAVNIS